MSAGYRSGGRPALEAVQAALAISELLGSLGLGAMAKQAAAERDAEALQLYARIVLKKAPADRRPAMRERLEALGLL